MYKSTNVFDFFFWINETVGVITSVINNVWYLSKKKIERKTLKKVWWFQILSTVIWNQLKIQINKKSLCIKISYFNITLLLGCKMQETLKNSRMIILKFILYEREGRVDAIQEDSILKKFVFLRFLQFFFFERVAPKKSATKNFYK